MLKEAVILPNEILEILLSYFNDDEVAICSGIDTRWYAIARRCLAKRTGFELCRWPDEPTIDKSRICLAGYHIAACIGRYKWKRLRRLTICFDEPTHLAKGILEQIFVACKHLSRLELLNLASIDSSQAEVILDRCCPGLELRLCLQKLTPCTSEAIDLLKDNRELLSEITIEIKESKTLLGWCPIPTKRNEIFVKDDIQAVELDCSGLLKTTFNERFNSLKSLTLSNCYSMLDDHLIQLSRLHLTSFHVSQSKFKESEWIHAFNIGFSSLENATFINCSNFTDAVLNSLSNKSLENLTVDLRDGASENLGISHMHRLRRLKRLYIFINQMVTNQLLIGVTHYWTNLLSLTVEESIVGYDFKSSTVNSLLQNLNSKPNVEFEHILNRTKLRNNGCKNF